MSIRFGVFTLDEERRQLIKEGQPVPLSPKAFQLLQLLIAERPAVVAKEKIIEVLWPDVAVEEANVRNLIGEIRDVVGPDLIRTAHRLGYAFEGPAYEGRRISARLDDDLRAYPLADGTNVIGRDVRCGVMVDGRGVSRQHARIHVAAGTAELEDLGSKNGTWVNGVRVQSTQLLHDGDTIVLGAVKLTFRLQLASESTTTIECNPGAGPTYA